MKEPPELHELLGDDLPEDEVERLRDVDALLRNVPAPPHEIPLSLTHAVERVAVERARIPRRSKALVLAFAVLVAALAFGVGRWSGDESFEEAWSAELVATEDGQGAAAVVYVGERDEESGNMELVLDISGLPPLEPDEFYALWLVEDGEWGATCGYFSVGESETTVRMTVSYDIREFEAWAVSTGHPNEHGPQLLRAEIDPTA
ncbi:MAG TPA: anti-sigma factor [Gaiellaceae bacterium]|nr:anti-sigma factor [Gaiellaceae bacterium]